MTVVSTIPAILSLCYLARISTLKFKKQEKGYYICNKASLKIGCHISAVVLLLSIVLYCIYIINGTVK